MSHHAKARRASPEPSLQSWFTRIAEAHQRIGDAVHRTPVVTSATLDGVCGARVFLKCENLQRTGAFKIRGATNAVRSLTGEERRRGVVAHSSGNHAQAVALAARMAGTRAHIVMPEDSSPVKLAATRGYGAQVHLCKPTLASREETAARLQEEHDLVLVHPFDDDRVIAGQGTAAKELLEEMPDLDVLLAPVSGGGLLSGSAIAARSLCPGIRIIGCEPLHADDAHRSFREGSLQPGSARATIADGLRATLSEKTLGLLLAFVDEIVTVPEEAILPALLFVLQRIKLVIEPSSAVVIAPLLSGALDVKDKKVGVILSGGNVGPEVLGMLGAF